MRLLMVLIVSTIVGCAASPGTKEVDSLDLAAITKLASEGDLSAQHRLCYIYSYGDKGVSINYKKAIQWCEVAAEKGSTSSMTLYAEKFYLGQGMPIDYKAARVWYLKAAEKGHAHAQYILATLYFRGLGTKINNEQGFYWLTKAAAQDYKPAVDLLRDIEREQKVET